MKMPPGEGNTRESSSSDGESLPPLRINTSDSESGAEGVNHGDGGSVHTGDVGSVARDTGVKHRVDMGRRIIHVSQTGADLSGKFSSYACKECTFWYIGTTRGAITDHFAKHHLPELETLTLREEGNYTRTPGLTPGPGGVTRYSCSRCTFHYDTETDSDGNMLSHYSARHPGFLGKTRIEDPGVLETMVPEECYERQAVGSLPVRVTMYKCKSCEFVHPCQEGVAEHAHNKHPQPKYKCRSCGLTFKIVGLYTAHMRKCTSGNGVVPGSPPAEVGWHQMAFTVRGPAVPLPTPGTTPVAPPRDKLATFSPNSQAANPKYRAATPASGSSGHSEVRVTSPAISIKSEDSYESDDKSRSRKVLPVVKVPPEDKDQFIKLLLQNKQRSARPFGGDDPGDLDTFRCRYHKDCSHSGPNQTEAILRHIVARHTATLSSVTVTAITKSIDFLSGAAEPDCSLPATHAHWKPEPENLSLKPDRTLNGGLVNGHGSDSDTTYTRLKRRASSISGAAPGGSSSSAGWRDVPNTCSAINVNPSQQLISCRHQGFQDEALLESVKPSVFVCRACFFWCLNISDPCVLLHAKKHAPLGSSTGSSTAEPPLYEEHVPAQKNPRDAIHTYFSSIPTSITKGKPSCILWACPSCDFLHPYKEMTRIHHQMEHLGGYRVYTCKLCAFSGSCITTVVQHLRHSHKGKVPTAGPDNLIQFNKDEHAAMETALCEATKSLKCVNLVLSPPPNTADVQDQPISMVIESKRARNARSMSQ